MSQNNIDISSFLNDTPQLYSSLFTTKDNSTIPVFSSGRTMESRYYPENDAARFADTIPASSFYIILGIGSGIVIDTLLKKYPDSFFLCIDKDDKEINFLLQIPLVKNLSENPHIKFSSLENLSTSFESLYIPALYGGLYVVEQKSWIQEIEFLYPLIQRIIKTSLNNVSADFSAQSHFGKIWQKNIINNLKIFSQISQKQNNILPDKNITFEKIAAIIAAGPSLDKTISILSNQRENYYIISTDTAYTSLLRNKIIPDAVISIDGQNVSHSHFFKTSNLTSTLFIFDLCSDCNAVKHISEKSNNIIFSVSGHPLSELIYSISPDSFIHLFSGSGTVTISALDFAVKSGFNSIQIFGADFSYLNTKTYTKGTYLDDIFSQNAFELNTTEYNFLKLLYRTELIDKSNGKKTTNILESYKQSFENYLSQNNYNFSKENDIYFISVPRESSNISNNSFSGFGLKKNDNKIEYSRIIEQLLNLLQNNNDNSSKSIFFDLNPLDIALLPLISWLRFYDNNNSSFQFYLKKAYNSLSRILNQDEK